LWTIHDLFNEISLYLKSNYNTEIITQIAGLVYVKEFNYYIGDCEILIYDDKLDILKGISFSEAKTDILDVFKKRNNRNDVFVLLHHLNWGVDIQQTKNYNFSVIITTFYPFSPMINYDYFYRLRQLMNKNSLIDKMFFKTTTGRGDEKELFELGLINEPFHFKPFDEYLEMSINYKVGLSIPGGGYELCHRDFDCMAIGLPLLRLEIIGDYNPKLISNFHYISVPRDNLGYDNFKDLRGGEIYLKEYEKRFYQVKNDFDFLEFISQNARKYYQENISNEMKLVKIINLLKI
jgi:hypothetical protein